MYTEILLPDKRIVFTDDETLFNEEKAAGTCLVTTINSGLEGADGYIENEEQLSELSDDYFSRIYDRHEKKPHIIYTFPYAGNEVTIRELTAKDYESYLSICSEGENGIFGTEGCEELSEELIAYQKASEEEKRVLREGFGENVLKNYRLLDFGLWITYISDRPLAIAGLMAEDDGVYIGYIVKKEYRNKGLATFICRRILTYAEDELGITAVKARVDKENIPSVRVTEKLGIEISG